MKQLDVVRKMEGTFGDRGLRCHAGECRVVSFGWDDSMTAIVLDLSVSRKILLSKSFGSFDYFDAVYRRFADSKYALDVVRDFFQKGPIFLEGGQRPLLDVGEKVALDCDVRIADRVDDADRKSVV